MKIQTVIDKLKAYHYGKDRHGDPIDETKTRDKVLWGDTTQECTGIVTTCFASVPVIQQAIAMGCNLIISHEALFWNHGDHTDWLHDNEIFQKKIQLLDSAKVVVWRDHDYIHSGIPEQGKNVDGIFYGVMKKLGWEKYWIGDPKSPTTFQFDEAIDGEELLKLCIDRFNLNGVRYVGDLHTPVRKVMIPGHLIGGVDNATLAKVESENFDCLISMEITDFTMSEYIRDSANLDHPRLIIEVGHFNTEEPGMEYMVNYINNAIDDPTMPVHFVKSADGFHYWMNGETA